MLGTLGCYVESGGKVGVGLVKPYLCWWNCSASSCKVVGDGIWWPTQWDRHVLHGKPAAGEREHCHQLTLENWLQVGKVQPAM